MDEQKYFIVGAQFCTNSSPCDKAPGPDDFNMGCIKSLRGKIKLLVLKCFEELSSRGKFPSGINLSFITLIPKVEQPKLVSDFRPISMMNSISKLFMKALSYRFGLVMRKLVSDN